MFIKYIFVILFLTCCCPINAKENKYNLAFDEQFISYLADRLALQLARSEHLEPNPNLDETENGFRQMHLMDVRMNYRSKLISCDGPLKELSIHLKDFEFYESLENEDKFKTGVLSFVGSRESEIWPIVEKWNVKVRDEIMKTHDTGFKVFPDCIVDGYELKVAK